MGVYVVAQPDAAGNVEVVERLRLRTPAYTIRITPPTPAVDAFATLRPRVVDLQVESRGAPVAVGSPLLAASSLPLGAPSTEISLRYRLEGVSARSRPSPIGRALVALPPVTADGLGDLPVVIEVVGSGVRNLVCLQLPTSQQLCGRQHGRVWSTTPIVADRSSVVAQVDLPVPGAS